MKRMNDEMAGRAREQLEGLRVNDLPAALQALTQHGDDATKAGESLYVCCAVIFDVLRKIDEDQGWVNEPESLMMSVLTLFNMGHFDALKGLAKKAQQKEKDDGDKH